MTEPDYLGNKGQTFRDFLKTCAALAAIADGASEPVSEDRAAPILKAVLETVLPFEHPKFPLTAHAMGGHFEALFSRKPGHAAAWRESLRLFNRTEDFVVVPVSVLAAERRALEAYPANTPEKVQKHLEQKRAHDEKLLAFFLKKQGIEARPFAELDPAARKEYFWLWSQSAFALKRRFYRSCRGAIMALAHAALPAAWP